MVEHCIFNGRVYALVIRRDVEVETVKFFTPGDYPLQVGVQQHKKGYTEPPHYHKRVERAIDAVHQVVHVMEGRINFEFFENDGTKVGSTIARPGDTILLTEHGHKMTILEDIKTVTVKQGPYLGEADDKVEIEEKVQ